MSTDPPEQTEEKHIAVLLMVVMVNGVMVTKKCPNPESLTAPQDEKVLWS